jgi:uncharacterized protein YecT (DUF1311 family)
MKFFLLITIFVLSIIHSFGQTQYELNQAEYKKCKEADKELNIVYQKILKEYKEDTTFIKNLKASQTIWIQFRDAEMKMKYPERGPGYYGSIQPLCQASYIAALTESRVKTLKIWLEGIEEGDGCAGSVKTKH